VIPGDIERLCSVLLLLFEGSGLSKRHALDVLVVRPWVVAAPLKHEHLVGFLLVVCQKRHMRWRKRPHTRARKHTVSLPSTQGPNERRSQRGKEPARSPAESEKKRCVWGGGGAREGLGAGRKARGSEASNTHVKHEFRIRHMSDLG
jgi:hypothetical protein